MMMNKKEGAFRLSIRSGLHPKHQSMHSRVDPNLHTSTHLHPGPSYVRYQALYHPLESDRSGHEIHESDATEGHA